MASTKSKAKKPSKKPTRKTVTKEKLIKVIVEQYRACSFDIPISEFAEKVFNKL